MDACVEGKQTRTNYRCSAETNYQCQAYTEERSCIVAPPEVIPGLPTWLVVIVIVAVVSILAILIKKRNYTYTKKIDLIL